MFDPTAEHDLARPRITDEIAVRAASTVYGLDVIVKELGSNQDRNYLCTVRGDERGRRFLLKFDNAISSDAEIEAQNEGLLLLAGRHIPVPTPVRAPGGAWIATVDDDAGEPTRVRLLTFVEGESLVDEGHLAARTISELGTLAGRVTAELAGLESPALERDLQWDLRNAMAVVDGLASSVADDERRATTVQRARAAWARVQQVAGELPIQPIHGDLTDDNVVGPRDALGRVTPTSVIDFGDLATGWRVAEIAVTVSSVLHHQPGRPLDALPAIAAFNQLVPLSEAEIRALWPLVVLRGAVLVVSGEHQVALEEGNDYARERMAHEWRLFEEACSLTPVEAEEAIRAALGQPLPATPTPAARLLPSLTTDTAEYVRLDSESPHLHRGAWLEPGIEARLAGELTDAGRFAVFAYGEPRLTRTVAPGVQAPVNTPLFLEVGVPSAGSAVTAPFAGTAELGEHDAIVLRGDFGTIEVRGASPAPGLGGDVSAGAELGQATPGAQLDVRWFRPDLSSSPVFVDAEHLPLWRRLTIDPAPLLGLEPADWLADPALERVRRGAAMAAAAERYYEQAPEIERGWRDLLIDTNGRAYVDMVNNVSGVGHADPRLADAVHAQMLLLNTNSRFLYRKLADYLERLVELAPDPKLSSVFLVNSGSEAVDLAIHLAQVHTGRRDVVTLREGYHGWTMASDAVSTSAYDNPHADGSRPEWVHVVDAVNSYRGTHRGPDAGIRYAADFEWKLGELDGMGHAPGAFICEPVFGNGGGIVFPDGTLRSMYESIRRHGGLAIADEVQVGLGRLGHHFWGVDQQGVVPDILAVAKALGNAYPLGAVYTTPEIAASLGRDGMFFSSAGGAIASAAAGLAVLDVLRDDELQGNAAVVGDHLRARVEALMERHPLIGAYHGLGLYAGVEFVRDRDTKEPASEEAEWVCERMLDFGVIVQTTSERRNVLKVKPPLCLTVEHAEVFIEALDRALGELTARE